jgi:hypothetical protein
MFNFLFSRAISSEKVESDFSVEKLPHPGCCAKCNKMHPKGTKFGWVASSCNFPGSVRNYDELKLITEQSSSKAAWCLPCIKSPATS